MTTTKQVLIAFCMLWLIQSCNQRVANSNSNNSSNSEMAPQYFSNSTECAAQAKTDMMEALRSNQFKFNIREEDLKSAEAGAEIDHATLDLDKLLAGQAKSIGELTVSENTYIVPFKNTKGILTTASVAKSDKGFQIRELFNKKFSNDLNMIMAISAAGPPESMRYISVPNLDAVVVEVTHGGQAMYYTDLNNQGVINRQAMDGSKLMTSLQVAAQEFNRLNGDALKKNKLVR